MTAHPTTDVSDDASRIEDPDGHPFETDDHGQYRVTQPLDGAEPDEMSVTIDGRTYRLSEYRGKDVVSRVIPDVLVYGSLEVFTDD